MSERFTYGMPPVEAIRQLNGLDDDVAAAKTAGAAAAATAAASASLASGNATSAAAARDAAIAAWQASTAPAEQLAAISKQAHQGGVVDVFLYDTSRDSDGGAWRKRCKHTSWENEVLVLGKWLGTQAVGSAAGIIAAGGIAGDYFQYGADSKFYRVDSLANAGVFTEVFRGNSREFPALALLVLEAGRLVIYDAARPELPMWMVFSNPGTASWNSSLLLGATGKAVAAMNGMMYVGENGNSQGLVAISFIADNAKAYTNVGNYGGRDNAPLALRNTAGHTFVAGSGFHDLPQLYSNAVTDLSVAVLPDAPNDPTTGLPIPTVALATTGGVSIIKPDDTSVGWLTSGFGFINGIHLDRSGQMVAMGGSTVAYKNFFLNGIPAATYNSADSVYAEGNIPERPGSNGNTGNMTAMAVGKSYTAFGSSNLTPGIPGLQFYKYIPNNPVKSMVAFVSATYSSGWLVGDSRAAWLADTVAGVVNAPAELITNGDASGGVAGWTKLVADFFTVSGRFEAIAQGAYGGVSQVINTIPGKQYVLSADIVEVVTGRVSFIARDYNTGTNLAVQLNIQPGKVIHYFTAVDTTTKILFEDDGVGNSQWGWDNVTCKMAEPDRGSKGRGTILKGAITKAAVADGAQLVSYSGFNALNFFEQPYNGYMDLGTSDFLLSAWVRLAAAPSAPASVMCRVAYSAGAMAGNGFQVYIDQNLKVTAGTTTAGFASNNSVVVSQAAVPIGIPVKLDIVRRNSTLEIWINGKQDLSFGSAADNVNNASATVRIGLRQDGNLPFPGSIALARIGTTAPSLDQIQQMYREELALFQPGAQCTMDGGNGQVKALAYDPDTHMMHAVTAWGRNGFRGLRRVDSEASANAAASLAPSIAAINGAVVIGGQDARYAQPAITLREELKRQEAARRAAGMEEIAFDFDGVGAQTQFFLPYGFTPKNVFVSGSKKRLGATKDYTLASDGYRSIVMFGVSPGATWVQITANRSL